MTQWSYSGLKAFETWKAIPGYTGLYEASSHGRVRRLLSQTPLTTRWGKTVMRTTQPRVLRSFPTKHGYAEVRLCKNGVVTTQRVARLVLLAFKGPARGREAGHLDDNPRNDQLRNLAWQTRLQNEQQKTQHGRRPASTVSKLTPTDVRRIRKLRTKGHRLVDIAGMFGCHTSNIGLICQGKTWGHV